MFSSVKRIAAASFAGVMAVSIVLPAFVKEAAAAPLPISTGLAVGQSVQGNFLPLTDVRYRRYGGRGYGGGAAVLGVLGLGLGIAAIAAQDRAQRRRDRLNEQYYNGGYYQQPGYYQDQGYYAQPAPVYAPQRYYAYPTYAQPRFYAPRTPPLQQPPGSSRIRS